MLRPPVQRLNALMAWTIADIHRPEGLIALLTAQATPVTLYPQGIHVQPRWRFCVMWRDKGDSALAVDHRLRVGIAVDLKVRSPLFVGRQTNVDRDRLVPYDDGSHPH